LLDFYPCIKFSHFYFRILHVAEFALSHFIPGLNYSYLIVSVVMLSSASTITRSNNIFHAQLYYGILNVKILTTNHFHRFHAKSGASKDTLPATSLPVKLSAKIISKQNGVCVEATLESAQWQSVHCSLSLSLSLSLQRRSTTDRGCCTTVRQYPIR